MSDRITRCKDCGGPVEHKRCDICHKQIHSNQSWHANGERVVHEACEMKEMEAKRAD